MNLRTLALIPFFAAVSALASCEDDSPRQPTNTHQGGGADGAGVPVEGSDQHQQPELHPEG